MEEYSQKLTDIAKNSAKQRLHKTVVKVKQICENLKREQQMNILYLLISQQKNKRKEKMIIKKEPFYQKI